MSAVTLCPPTTAMSAKLTAASLVPPPSKASRKRNLGPGCGMLDWVRLCRSGKDLTGVGGNDLTVTEEHLAKHCTPEDGWTAIRGKVYNITPYFKFHPGGKEELMKALGKDCTKMFDEAHKWVRVETMLAKCLVGVFCPGARRRRASSVVLSIPRTIIPLKLETCTEKLELMSVREETRDAEPVDEPDDGMRQNSPGSPEKVLFSPISESEKQKLEEHSKPEEGGSNMATFTPPLRMRRTSDNTHPSLRMNWSQSDNTVTVCLQVQSKMQLHHQLKASDIVLEVHGNTTLQGTLFVQEWCYEISIELFQPVESSRVEVAGNKVKLHLTKQLAGTAWKELGVYQPNHGQVCTKTKRICRFHKTTVDGIHKVNHDTKLFTLRLPSTAHMIVPTGCHVTVKHGDLERSYTPVIPLSVQHDEFDGKSLHLMIKLYEHGTMSKYLSSLCIGDSVMVSDFEGSFEASRLKACRDIVLIAAGSGFTPMVKLICNINRLNKQDLLNRKTKLIFANKREQDIMWKEELSAVQEENRLEVTHVLSNAKSSWTGLCGRVSEDILKKTLPEAPPYSERDRLLVCVCGPTPFTESLSNLLLEMNYHEDSIHLFT